MKHFVDIERLRATDDEFKVRNNMKFIKGNRVVIQTKIDGSNAQCSWDEEKNCIAPCSRKQELHPSNTLNGFWNYCQTLNPMMFSLNPNWIIFGEWVTKHTITYNSDVYKNWYVYDIYNKSTEMYLPQDKVKEWCERWGINYIETFYDGEFISWEHVMSFLHESKLYGDTQEGVVIKNQEYLKKNEVEDSRQPSYIKIVNKEFSEVHSSHSREKKDNTERDNEMTNAREILETIVTKNRVIKEIHKMRDEGILPQEFKSEDMSIIARNLPKRIIEDCLKEEREVFLSAGQYGGKVTNAIVMSHARDYLFGEG